MPPSYPPLGVSGISAKRGALVGGLPPATVHWYRFSDDSGARSRIGRTVTAPRASDPHVVRFAFVSRNAEAAISAAQDESPPSVTAQAPRHLPRKQGRKSIYLVPPVAFAAQMTEGGPFFLRS